MMRRICLVVFLAAALAACTGEKKEETAAAAGPASWQSSPEKVVEALMHAYATRDDSLYAELLADDFHYYFEPPGEDSTEVLGWGREEDIVSTGNLFRTPEVVALSLRLDTGAARPAGRNPDWMMVPIGSGELRVDVKDKDPMRQTLNRQEIYVRRDPLDPSRWRIVEWRDYPAP